MVSRRQEVGRRGLRLSVNQHGERMDNPAVVHEINVLTVVAREGHKDFVSGLQKQISETLSARRFGFDAVLIEAGCRAIDMAGSLDVALWRDGSVL